MATLAERLAAWRMAHSTKWSLESRQAAWRVAHGSSNWIWSSRAGSESWWTYTARRSTSDRSQQQGISDSYTDLYNRTASRTWGSSYSDIHKNVTGYRSSNRPTASTTVFQWHAPVPTTPSTPTPTPVPVEQNNQESTWQQNWWLMPSWGERGTDIPWLWKEYATGNNNVLSNNIFQAMIRWEQANTWWPAWEIASNRYNFASWHANLSWWELLSGFNSWDINAQQIQDIAGLNPEAVAEFKSLKRNKADLDNINWNVSESINSSEIVNKKSNRLDTDIESRFDMLDESKDILAVKKNELFNSPAIIEAENKVDEVNKKLADIRTEKLELADDIRNRFSGKATSWFVNAKIRKETNTLNKEEARLMNESTFEQNSLKRLTDSAEDEYNVMAEQIERDEKSLQAEYERWVKDRYATVAEANAEAAESSRMMSKITFLSNSWWLSGLNEEEISQLEQWAWLPAWTIDGINATQDEEQKLAMIKALWKTVSDNNANSILQTMWYEVESAPALQQWEKQFTREWVTMPQVIWWLWIPIEFERAIKNTVPTQLLNSDEELKQLNANIKLLHAAWLTPNEALLKYQWFNLKDPKDYKTAFNLISKARKTINMAELDLPGLSDQINTWDLWWAVLKIETAVNDKLKEQLWDAYIHESDVRDAMKKASELQQMFNPNSESAKKYWVPSIWWFTWVATYFSDEMEHLDKNLNSLATLYWKVFNISKDDALDQLPWKFSQNSLFFQDSIVQVKNDILEKLNNQRKWKMVELDSWSLKNFKSRADRYNEQWTDYLKIVSDSDKGQQEQLEADYILGN